MNNAIASGEIFVGYGNAENNGPVRDAWRGRLYKANNCLVVRLRAPAVLVRFVASPTEVFEGLSMSPVIAEVAIACEAHSTSTAHR